MLAIRLLSPPGFMPAFERGGMTIVACPEGASLASSAAPHHHKPQALHQACPYAAAASTATHDNPVAEPNAPILGPDLATATWASWTPPSRRAGERPPATGPPSLT